MKRTLTALTAIALCCALAAAIAGCGGSSTAQDKQSLATDLHGLQKSLAQLLDSDTYESLDTFNETWAGIEEEYEKVVADARKLKETSIADLEDAYEELKKSIGDVKSDQSLEQKATAILAAAGKFLTALQNVINDVNPPE